MPWHILFRQCDGSISTEALHRNNKLISVRLAKLRLVTGSEPNRRQQELQTSLISHSTISQETLKHLFKLFPLGNDIGSQTRSVSMPSRVGIWSYPGPEATPGV